MADTILSFPKRWGKTHSPNMIQDVIWLINVEFPKLIFELSDVVAIISRYKYSRPLFGDRIEQLRECIRQHISDKY